MTSNSLLVASSLARIPDVRQKLGIFVGRVGVKAQVNVGSSSPVLKYVGTSFPSPGDPVQLELRDGEWVCTGSARPKPGEGVITGTGTPRAKVTAWSVEYELRYDPAYTPVLADLVTISWSADGEGVITGKVSASSNVVGPGIGSGAGSGIVHPPPFTAVDSASWFSGHYATSDVYASASYDGAWWYGSKIRDTIPDSAVISSAYIYLPIRRINVNAPGQMRIHSDASRPGGAPNFFGAADPRTAESGWRTVSTAWIDYLKSNDGGIGFDGGGYWIIKGIPSDGLSGALDITYQA